jgi:two-component system response regulator RegX3
VSYIERSTAGPLRVGPASLVADGRARALEFGGARVPLTQLEFELLRCLGEVNGRLLTRAQILDRVWNDRSGIRTRTVDVHVAALRKKLADVRAPLAIASVRGVGYRLDHS